LDELTFTLDTGKFDHTIKYKKYSIKNYADSKEFKIAKQNCFYFIDYGHFYTKEEMFYMHIFGNKLKYDAGFIILRYVDDNVSRIGETRNYGFNVL
jgi:hypothetical protein